jgi:hypothetical protein
MGERRAGDPGSADLADLAGEALRQQRSRRAWWLVIAVGVVLVAGASLVAVGLVRGNGRSADATSPVDLPVSAPPLAGSSAPATPSLSASPSRSAAPSRSPAAHKPANLGTSIPNRPNCGPNPGACGLPDASNTGVPAGTSLRVVSGDVAVRKAGTVIDGEDIRGCVRVEAKNVTIRRSKVTCTNFYAIASFSEDYSGGGLLIQNVEIDCKASNGTGIGYYGFTARRVNIHGCENGFDIDNTATVTDTYVHDGFTGNGAHTDGIQLAGGAHITITHNTLLVGGTGTTSAIISNPSKNSDVLVSNNLLGGGTYTLYCPRDSSTAFRVINNHFSTVFFPQAGQYGPWDACGKVAEEHGNVWDNTLRPLGG